MAHRSFKAVVPAARLSSSDSNSNTGRRRRRRRRRRRAPPEPEQLQHLGPHAGPGLRPGPLVLLMRPLLDRLHAALAPAPDADRLVAAAPAVTLRAAFRRFWPLTRSLRGVFFVGLVFAALLPAVEAAEIWIFKLIVDDVLDDRRSWGRCFGYGLVVLALALLGAALSFGDEYIATWVGERFTLALRTRVFSPISSGWSPTRSIAAATATCSRA